MLPVACRRCIHLIAELGLTSNQSAASRRDAPDSTASTTRSRNSKEHGFGIDPPSRIRINAARFNYPSLLGNPDSTQPKSALVQFFRQTPDILGFSTELFNHAGRLMPRHQATEGAGTHARLADRRRSATAQSIELMLKSESFNVYTTNLGEEGIDLGKIYDYDIILLDLNLPDMPGFEVFAACACRKSNRRS